MSQTTLCQLFGATPAVVCRTLAEAMSALLQALETMSEARVQWPTLEEMESYAETIAQRYPPLRPTHIFAFADGTTLDVENSSDALEQNAYYSRPKGRTVVNNLFTFTPDGCICHATVNAPGSWHDGTLADAQSGLYKKLLHRTPRPYRIVADQGFCLGSVSGKIALPLKTGQVITNENHSINAQVDLHQYYTTVRQAAEWGMRAFKSSFARLKETLTVNVPKRGQLLRVCVRLYNYRVRMTGLNQIYSTYHPLWGEDVILDKNYDRIVHYYKIQTIEVP